MRATFERLATMLLVGLLAAPAAAQEGVQLRPIDEATVRVIGLSGISATAGPGRTTGVRRVGVDPSMGHGSGVAISPRLVLTARHVVWGMSTWAVVPPGESAPIAARPVYVDLEHDVAFVEVERDLPHHIDLPGVRALRMNESVSVSGYPLDMREPNPAAASGEVSRITRDGLLHLTMTVNPGNSGGPVIDGDGRLIGIISMRGRPERGIEGLTIAVPLSAILRARGHVPTRHVTFRTYEHDLARAVALLSALSEEALSERRGEIRALVQRAVAHSDLSPEHRLVFAALAWNTVLTVMESEQAVSADHLSPAARADAGPLYRAAVDQARSALREAPHVRRRFPGARPIALGRTAPFGTQRTQRR